MKIYEVSVNGKTECFLNMTAVDVWLSYQGYPNYDIHIKENVSLFETLTTFEDKWFPTGKETDDMIELARGKKLGLTSGTWIPNPNPKKEDIIWCYKM